MFNTYPLFRNNEVIGAVSIMRDYSKIKELFAQGIHDASQRTDGPFRASY